MRFSVPVSLARTARKVSSSFFRTRWALGFEVAFPVRHPSPVRSFVSLGSMPDLSFVRIEREGVLWRSILLVQPLCQLFGAEWLLWSGSPAYKGGSGFPTST